MTSLQTPQVSRFAGPTTPAQRRPLPPPFVRHIGIAAPLPHRNLDTDIINPYSPGQISGLSDAEKAFEPIRYFADGSENPDFVLNQEPYRTASILLAGANFGTGSARGGGVGLPMAFGIRVVIASSFGPIWYLNAARRGMLAVTLDEEVIAGMTDWVVSNPGVEMMVDLEGNVIEAPGLEPISFSMNPRIRDKLLTGSVDELDEMLEYSEGATELRTEDRIARPWIYSNATGANR